MPWFASSAVFETAQDIPAEFFKKRVEIAAIVEQVSDGDTFRVRHIKRSRDKVYSGSLKDHTIVVRAAAVDAPETDKQGRQGQPFSREATEFAKAKLLGKVVSVKLLSKDQYGRVIGMIKYKEGGVFGWFQSTNDISEELVKQGLAVVYRQGGAQYDGPIERWNVLERKAKQAKRGMWMRGNDLELPSEFKARQRMEQASKTLHTAKNRANAL